MHLGFVVVTSSSLIKEGSVENAVSWTHDGKQRCYTNQEQSPWFQFSLTSYSIVPNYYSLRFGNNNEGCILRNWELQGQESSGQWKTLRKHVGDTTLTKPFQEASWQINDVSTAYSVFRIILTGKDYLLLCGFEIYGLAKKKDN